MRIKQPVSGREFNLSEIVAEIIYTSAKFTLYVHSIKGISILIMSFSGGNASSTEQESGRGVQKLHWRQ